MSSLQISCFDGNGEKWDKFVREFSSCFYHQFAWQYVVKDYWGFLPCYLAAYRNNTIVGVLPLCLTRSIFSGKGLVSLPGSDEAGIIAEDDKVARLLLDKAIQLARDLNLNYIELRHTRDIFPDIYSYRTRATLYLRLPASAEELWRSLRPEKRNMVRKAQRNGLCFLRVPDDKIPGALNIFFRINALNKRHLGSPFYGLSFFSAIHRHFPRQFHLFFVAAKNTIVGGAIGLSFNKRLTVPVAGSLPDYFPFAPNDLLYWGILEFACNNGYNMFDFGRSPLNSGTYHFKRRWGAEVVQLYYHHLEFKNNVSKSSGEDIMKISPFLKFASSSWKKAPYFLIKKAGPYIMKQFP